MAIVSTSAAGLLAQLDEDDDVLRLSALESLNSVVHEFWFQIASSIASVEAFYEDESFTHRKLAALLASKVFYYLGELEDALTYALGAGDLFDITERSDYVNALMSTCIDKYIELRNDRKDGDPEIDPRLEDIVERKFQQCLRDGAYSQAIGIALDARRLDQVEAAIKHSNKSHLLIDHVIHVTQNLVVNRAFREDALTLLLKMAEDLPEKNWGKITQCFAFLDDAPKVAKIIAELLKGTEDDVLMAYQICYDLFENEMQAFMLKVEDTLAEILNIKTAADAAPAEAAAEPAEAAPAANGDAPDANGAAPMDTDDGPSATGTSGQEEASTPAGETNGSQTPELSPEEKQLRERLTTVQLIMRGNSSIQLYLEFLHGHNHADLQVMRELKAKTETRSMIIHGAVVFANAIMHSGTTIDSYLRDNLDWLARATNWSKFSATAGLGVIHRGHLSQGKALMAPYLPAEGQLKSGFSEGGALYALGLIHANHGQDIRQFLVDSLKATNREVVQHGACLGLGLAALGSNEEDIIDLLKEHLYQDEAVTSEAAGIALGLVCAGTASEHAAEILAYTHETQHEKIIRGCALGLALIMYGREEGADTLIEQMTRDQDPLIRYGGIQTIAMAYRGTANNAAIQKLLHFAVSDVSDDVRRAAVMCLGFVLIGSPEQCPKIVALLSESYNPHVRYGAAMAVGIACSCTGNTDALAILDTLRRDTVDYVRQGTHIATALILMQRPNSEVKALRKELLAVAGDKHEEVMARMGGIMALGILDAGGRNTVVGLRSQSGFYRRTSCIGMMIFTQYWFWYPLSYFLSLALQPTAFIGVNKDLDLPFMELGAYGKASMWAYPPPIKQEDSNKAAKVPQAVLSTTRKVEAVKAQKEAEKAAKAKKDGSGDVEMTTDETKEEDGDKPLGGAGQSQSKPTEQVQNEKPAAKDETKKGAEGKSDGNEKDGKAEPEPKTHISLKNPTRIPNDLASAVYLKKDRRYHPIDKHHAYYGIVVLKDTKPGDKIVLAGVQETEETGEAAEAKPQGDNLNGIAPSTTGEAAASEMQQ